MSCVSSQKRLLRLQISLPDVVYNRVIYTDLVPNDSDLHYYYQVLLGLEDAVVTWRVEDVPAEFNTALLDLHEEAPVSFPHYDLKTAPDQNEMRKKYDDFLNQLCEMEKSRASLRLFARASASTATATAATATATSSAPDVQKRGNAAIAANRREWVRELLNQLNGDEEAEAAFQQDSASAIVQIQEDPTHPPHAWILTPTCEITRNEKGSRILVDKIIADHWDPLLGTTLYPDLIVSRRISTASWSFQHPTCEEVVGAMVRWYLASQKATLRDGLSCFIPDADSELSFLLTQFRRIKVNPEFLLDTSESDDSKNPTRKIFQLMTAIESRLLSSELSNPIIHSVSIDALRRYVTYVFRASNVPREIYSTQPGVEQMLHKWSRAKMGFLPGVDPLIPQWKETWELVMRGDPNAERVNHFLATLDAWDPSLAPLITIPEKNAIAIEWIRIFFDTQVVYDPESRIKSVFLHEQVKRWAVQFVPELIFSAQFSPMNIGPVATIRGYTTRKLNNGRFTHKIRLKNIIPIEGMDLIDQIEGAAAACLSKQAATPPAQAQAVAQGAKEVMEANTIQFSTITEAKEDGTKTRKRTLKQTAISSDGKGKGTRIEHFFAASVTTTAEASSSDDDAEEAEEIHLGNL